LNAGAARNQTQKRKTYEKGEKYAELERCRKAVKKLPGVQYAG
jgi:hypothetical protein